MTQEGQFKGYCLQNSLLPSEFTIPQRGLRMPLLSISLLRASKEESWFFMEKRVHPLSGQTYVALCMTVCMWAQVAEKEPKGRFLGSGNKMPPLWVTAGEACSTPHLSNKVSPLQLINLGQLGFLRLTGGWPSDSCKLLDSVLLKRKCIMLLLSIPSG